MRLRRLCLAATAAVLGAACSPALNWRELRLPDVGVAAMFPCKPDRHSRPVPLGGRATRMEMLVCSADGATFALAYADLDDPVSVAPVLEELRETAISNVNGTNVQEQALQVPGMTPNPRAVRLRLDGRRPDGAAVQEQAAFFVHGLRIYQATVLATALEPSAADTFIGGLRLDA
ncbi:MAG: hypothetical protein KF788_15695 [Piscinibacter sp.]|nr:hypothetical protein [Piscinibacter sp.]